MASALPKNGSLPYDLVLTSVGLLALASRTVRSGKTHPEILLALGALLAATLLTLAARGHSKNWTYPAAAITLFTVGHSLTTLDFGDNNLILITASGLAYSWWKTVLTHKRQLSEATPEP